MIRIIICHLNVPRNKFESLSEQMNGNVDIRLILYFFE